MKFRERAQAYMPLTPVTRVQLRAMYIKTFALIGLIPPPLPSPLRHFLMFSSMVVSKLFAVGCRMQ